MDFVKTRYIRKWIKARELNLKNKEFFRSSYFYTQLQKFMKAYQANKGDQKIPAPC